jgi:TolB protein
MDRNTGEARYLGLGTSPRFSPDGSQIVYTRTALDGNRDIWKADTRTGLQEPLTDGGEIDDVPDWSPDGQTVVFASSRGGELALWAVPASGGRRQRLNDGGYAPRFSPDGSRIAYWHEEAIWTADADGRDPVRVADAGQLAPPAWGRAGPAFFSDGAIRLPDGRALPLSIWPEFDHAGEDNWLVARLNIDKAELWSLDLTFVGE